METQNPTNSGADGDPDTTRTEPAERTGLPRPGESRPVEAAQTTADALPVAPSLGPTLAAMHLPVERQPVDGRVAYLCAVAVGIAMAAALVAQGLLHLIAFVTNLAFHGRLSFAAEGASPWDHQLGAWVIVVPVVGAVIIGFMARYGSKAIRGHGIPEAMEKVLTGHSRIPVRVMFLKPLSAAVAIGTGGPFGAEGPIIATGGALGSVVGQVLPTNADERKTLLACGAAAGMAATFGTPVAAVLLAVELLLFEFRARSLVPVALATTVAAGFRLLFEGSGAVFPMPTPPATELGPLLLYVLIGAVVGLAAVGVTKAVYAVEDLFEHLPIHWMWWPAVGAVAVGVIGYFYPRTLGVGYANITDILSGSWPVAAIAVLCVAKFASWSIYLGSGTSGGTLAPLLTIGGGLGAILGAAAHWLFPGAPLSVPVAALVGMAAMFAGSARALLASVVFAFEATRQPAGLLPLLGGCAAAYLVSALIMRNTIMTEKIVRRGVRVPADYAADFLDSVAVATMMTPSPVTVRSERTVGEVRAWIESRGDGTAHQGYPVVEGGGEGDFGGKADVGVVVGVLTRRTLLDPSIPADRRLAELLIRPPVVVYDDLTLRAAADHMVAHDVGRLPVVRRDGTLVGVITRGDLLRAHRLRLEPPRSNAGPNAAAATVKHTPAAA